MQKRTTGRIAARGSFLLFLELVTGAVADPLFFFFRFPLGSVVSRAFEPWLVDHLFIFCFLFNGTCGWEITQTIFFLGMGLMGMTPRLLPLLPPKKPTTLPHKLLSPKILPTLLERVLMELCSAEGSSVKRRLL